MSPEPREERLIKEVPGALGASAILDPDVTHSCDHNHFDVGLNAFEFGKRGKAVETGHLIIQKHDVEGLL
jgi:hypothetical protein